MSNVTEKTITLSRYSWQCSQCGPEVCSRAIASGWFVNTSSRYLSISCCFWCVTEVKFWINISNVTITSEESGRYGAVSALSVQKLFKSSKPIRISLNHILTWSNTYQTSLVYIYCKKYFLRTRISTESLFKNNKVLFELLLLLTLAYLYNTNSFSHYADNSP